MAELHDTELKNPTRLSRMQGCIFGGAVGDALGAPVQFLGLDEIRRRHGKTGITRMEAAFGRRGAITDNTRMALFTAEGLILCRVRAEYARGGLTIPAIYHAYLRWLFTQDAHRRAQLINDHGTCAVIDGILTAHPEFFSRRSTGDTCLSSLRSGTMGTMDRPINDSKGCGGVVRVAPVGLTHPDAEDAFRLGSASAAITHGHPTGCLAAGFMACLISRLMSGQPLTAATEDASRILKAHAGHEETSAAVDSAVELSLSRKPSAGCIEALGTGRVAEEALAIGLYCTMAAGDDFRRGVLLAVNHSGDSDSTGSITGNIIGAHLGVEVIPGQWLSALEMKAVIEEVAADLFDQFIKGK
jgi:ADP-ribosylglycohydrolase